MILYRPIVGFTLFLLMSLEVVSAEAELPGVRQLGYWQESSWQSTPLSDRIQGHAAAEVIDFLRKENAVHGFTEVPGPTTAPKEFLDEVMAVLLRLPAPITRLLAGSLTAIILVEDLGSTAFTELVLDDEDTPAAGFIVLDVGRLNRSANAWATYKANTPFHATEGFSLDVTIAAPENDDRSHAIQYILLHEAAHVLAAVDGTIHPRWDQELPPAQVLQAKYPFTALSWTIEAGEFNRFPHDVWPDQLKIPFYADPGDRISLRQAPEIYDRVSGSNYPTLYAATSPYEDFAESFVNYVHTVLLGLPYRAILVAENAATTYEACWQHPRCRSKRHLLETWLRNQGAMKIKAAVE